MGVTSKEYMKVTRRDLLVWSAGAAAGLLVTPVPWKVLDDVSIWSQNWPWIPQPARGPIEVKESFCTLCPNGCGLRVRMAAGWPVAVAGASKNPITRGALCPLAFGAHQLNWHPRRLKDVRHRGTVSSWPEAQAALAKASKEGPVVVIDGYPGRAASFMLEQFAAKHGSSYQVVLGAESRGLLPYEIWTGVRASSLGYDLENAKTIVSFGAPLLDGWGVPGRFTRLWAEHAVGTDDPQLRLIQIESTLSRTAARAWEWISIREGSESALAAGLARVLIEQKLVPARGPIPAVTVFDAAAKSGVSVDQIQELARTIAASRPALAISSDENPSIAALNLVLGSVGTRGGVVRRAKNDRYPVPAKARYPMSRKDGETWGTPTISGARAVLIDASVPWDFVPQTDAEIFRFAAWDGASSMADWLLPAPGFLEDLTDVPSAPCAAVESYALAPALVKPTADVRSAAQVLASIDSSLPSVDKIIHDRCTEIFRLGTGTLHGHESTPVAQIASAEKLEEQLRNGDVWIAEPATPSVLRCELKEWPSETNPASQAENWAARWPVPILPPLASKLYSESSLREAPAGRRS